MHVIDKFHHTMQFHPALSLQKVALQSPFFLFSIMAVFSLLSHLAGEMSGMKNCTKTPACLLFMN